MAPNQDTAERYHDWLNPLNKIVLIEAFKNKAKTVTLDDREFTINYKKRDGYAWIQPKEGASVPCGWFKMDHSVTAEWLMKG